MKNGDMPANAFDMDCDKSGMGLTKREMIAMHAMQGILANSASEDIGYNEWAKGVAKHSIEAADALLEELEKQQ